MKRTTTTRDVSVHLRRPSSDGRYLKEVRLLSVRYAFDGEKEHIILEALGSKLYEYMALGSMIDCAIKVRGSICFGVRDMQLSWRSLERPSSFDEEISMCVLSVRQTNIRFPFLRNVPKRLD